MRTRMKGWLPMLFVAFALMVAVPALALANNVINADLIEYTSQVASYTAGDTNGVRTDYWVEADNSGVCDPAVGQPLQFQLEAKQGGTDVTSAFKARLAGTDPSTAQPLSTFALTFNDCAPRPTGSEQYPSSGLVKEVVFTSDANLPAAQYKIQVNQSTISDPDPNSAYSPDNQNSFLINVSAPATSGGGGGGTGGDPCASVTVAAPTFTNTTPTYGSNGWFNKQDGIPTVSATSTGNQVSYATSASGPFGAAPTLSDGQTTVYAKATDTNGCSSSVSSNLYKVDTVDPLITPGDVTNTTWRNTPLSQQFTATDATSGLASNQGLDAYGNFTLMASAESTKDSNGNIVPTTVSKTVYDVAGNSTTRNLSAWIDLTPPLLNISGAASGTYDVCSIPSRPTFAPFDALSGLDGSQGDSWLTPSTEYGGVGTYTYSAHATDYATNASNATRTYTVVPDLNYTDTAGPFSGILQPVNIGSPPRSSFKLGSTVPIKFRMMCGMTPVTGLKVYLWLSRIDGTADPVNEAVATTTGTTGTLFRYDATSQQYIFNLATKGDYVDPAGNTIAMGQGTWYLYLQFGGTNQKVEVASIDLKK